MQQFSLDIQRELPGHVALTVGYIGSSSAHMSLTGTSSAGLVNLNRLPLGQLKLGEALNELVPNPFFGIPEAGELSGLDMIARAQLLRPFPQFHSVRA